MSRQYKCDCACCQKQRDYQRQYVAKRYQTDARRRYFNNKQSNASARGIEFTLKFKSVVWPETCPVLGGALYYGPPKGHAASRDWSPSFDRIDPSKGYTPENTRIISARANRIRHNASADELRSVADFYRGLESSRTSNTEELSSGA